ncbi:MAG: hypothetical protein AABY98_08390 [Candidatus Deferrimicrobiota bacterium]
MNRSGRLILLAVALFLIASCSAKKEALRPPPPRMEVVQLRLAGNGEFVGVRLRMIGGDRFDPEATEIYLVDESTGERFSVVRLQRIGRMAEFRVPGEKDVHDIMFRNREGKLKIGSRVTVVVGSARQEHLLVQP